MKLDNLVNQNQDVIKRKKQLGFGESLARELRFPCADCKCEVITTSRTKVRCDSCAEIRNRRLKAAAMKKNKKKGHIAKVT